MNILWRKEISLSLRLSVLDAHFWRRTLIESFIVDEPFVEVEETQTRGGSGQRGWVEGVPESCKGRLIPPWSHLIDVPRLPPSKSYCPSCSFQSALSFHSPFLCPRFHGIFPATMRHREGTNWKFLRDRILHSSIPPFVRNCSFLHLFSRFTFLACWNLVWNLRTASRDFTRLFFRNLFLQRFTF